MSTHLLWLTDRAVTNPTPGPMMHRCVARGAGLGRAGGETGLGRAAGGRGLRPGARGGASVSRGCVSGSSPRGRGRTRRPHQTALPDPRAPHRPLCYSLPEVNYSGPSKRLAICKEFEKSWNFSQAQRNKTNSPINRHTQVHTANLHFPSLWFVRGNGNLMS